MAYTLGIAPDALTVNLYAGSPFDAVLTDWEEDQEGAVVELRFKGETPTTWQTTVTGGTATFAEDASTVDARTSNEPVELWVDGAAWAAGVVVLRGS